MTYKEFYIWLEGFMTNRSWTVIQQVDIEGIQKKMKEVTEEPKFDIDKWKHLSNRQISSLPITIRPEDNDDLGKPPKIVM
jgi:hypothetical protein